MTETLEQAAARLGAQWVGGELKFLCPCHDDHNPSAYLTTSKKGNVIANCWVCDDWQKVTKAAGLWHEPAKRAKTQKARDDNKAATIDENITAVYDYRDELGTLLYQAIRYEEPGKEKAFNQRTPNGEGGWVYSTKGLRKVLYRLQELLAAPLDAWVFVVEGEKDVDNLRAASLVATCNVMGAGNWQKEYNEHLKGRKILLLPDNDTPGRDHSFKVAKALQDTAQTVRIVELPGLPEKGDVSDWLAAGGTGAQLLELAETAREYEAPKKQPKQRDETALSVSETIEYLVQDFGKLALCDLDNRVYLNGAPMEDPDMAPLEMAIHDYNGAAGKDDVRVPMNALKPQLLILAKRNRFHPVRDWLNSLKWDGNKHIHALASHFKDAHKPIEYEDGTHGSVFHALMMRWLIGACCRAFEATQNPVLVLAGKQGIGKSFLPGWLASPLGLFHGYPATDGNPFFCEGSIDPDSIDHQRRLTNQFVWEVGEVGGTMRKADLDALKSFLTKSAATFRIPWATNDVTKPALCNWIATVNPSVGFLADPTGNRRFRTVEVVAIDWAYSKYIDPSQVWAHAMELYRRGFTAELSAPQLVAVTSINRDHEATSNEEEAILTYFDIDPAQTGDDWAMPTKDIADFLIAHVHSCRHSKGVTPVGLALAKLTGRPTKRERLNDDRQMSVARGIKPNAYFYALKEPALKEPASNNGVSNETASSDEARMFDGV